MELAYTGLSTMDELELAMKQYGMGDEAIIKEAIEEVDTDNYKLCFPLHSMKKTYEPTLRLTMKNSVP